jgi:hypothetical protein
MIAPPKWSEPSKRQNLRSTPILLKVKNNLVLKGNYNIEAGQSIRHSKLACNTQTLMNPANILLFASPLLTSIKYTEKIIYRKIAVVLIARQ